MEMNAIFAVAILLDSRQKINITFIFLMYHLQFDLVEESDAKMFSSERQSADDSEYEYNKDHRPTLFGQEEANDLVRDLDLPKLSAFLLSSWLNSKHFVYTKFTFSWYKHREKECLHFFLSIKIRWFIVFLSIGSKS